MKEFCSISSSSIEYQLKVFFGRRFDSSKHKKVDWTFEKKRMNFTITWFKPVRDVFFSFLSGGKKQEKRVKNHYILFFLIISDEVVENKYKSVKFPFKFFYASYVFKWNCF